MNALTMWLGVLAIDAGHEELPTNDEPEPPTLPEKAPKHAHWKKTMRRPWRVKETKEETSHQRPAWMSDRSLLPRKPPGCSR
jgi:hypothetical protein